MPGLMTTPSRLLSGFLAASLLLAACTFDQNDRPGEGSAASPAPQVSPVAVQSQSSPGPAGPAVTTPVRGTPSAPGAPAAANGVNEAAVVYQRNGGSVVNITSVAVVPTAFGNTEQQGVGSGFILDNQGHIVTNNNVVQNADQLNVTFPDPTTVPAELVGRDPDNDLAAIRVDPSATDEAGRPVRDLIKPVTLGDSNQITIGEDAIAIGSPLGLQQTVTAGIVSALREPGQDTGPNDFSLLGGAVQTDAAINSGNSGGPLFNATGEVIGVNTAILSRTGGNIGIGFAIPVNVVKRVVPELIQRGCYRHPLVGVSTLPLAQLGQAVKRQLGIPANQTGLLVQESSAGAAQAGIRAGDRVVNLADGAVRVGGDIIVAVDGREVSSGGDLRAYIENNKRPGDTVTLTMLRGGQRQDVTVTLSERPSQGCR